MQFESEYKAAINQLNRTIESATIKLKELSLVADKTLEFLDICKQNGIKKVCIGTEHKSVPSSVGFVFGSRGNAFAMGTEKDGNWPLIWRVCEQAGVDNGCGNGNQQQIKDRMLIDGTYHCKKGLWYKID